MSAPVALVLVSHSTDLARGVADIAGQMAPDVVIRTAAGGPDGGLGTSFDAVRAAVADALVASAPEGGVVILADLGSSILTVETVLELDESLQGRVVLARGPFVEGAVAAAVTAHGGARLDEVTASALDAAHSFVPAEAGRATDGARGEAAAPSGSVRGTVTVRNPLGLHARPAALVSRKVAELGARVRIDGVDAASVLQLMALGATQGRELTVEAEGLGADAVVEAIVELIGSGFGEA